jgi:hypothetical protein
MGIAKGADTVAPLVTAKTTETTVCPVKAVVEGFSIGACLLELDMVLDFFGNGGRIFA